MNGRKHLFFLLNSAFLGFGISTLYGVLTAAIMWLIANPTEFRAYHQAFFVGFNFAISGGLVLTTYLLVLRTQKFIPETVRTNFRRRELEGTDYFDNERRFFSVFRTLAQSSSYTIVAFVIFYAARFPFRGPPEYFLMAFGCAQYTLGVYVGRKLFYIAQMIRSIDAIKVRRDLFSTDALSGILVYVNSISTMTSVFTFAVVKSCYDGPFQYESIFGYSAKMLMLLPAVIALPVLALFNYYPRGVVRRVYEQSIRHKLRRIRAKITDSKLSEFEKLAYLAEYDRVSQEELRYRLRMALTDLPMALTLGIAALSLLTKA
jgi:MFS family permease